MIPRIPEKGACPVKRGTRVLWSVVRETAAGELKTSLEIIDPDLATLRLGAHRAKLDHGIFFYMFHDISPLLRHAAAEL
jgi:hypothetical protein